MEHENYGTLIKNLRIQHGLTQNQVAEALGVTLDYISNVESGRTQCPYEFLPILLALSDALWIHLSGI